MAKIDKKGNNMYNGFLCILEVKKCDKKGIDLDLQNQLATQKKINAKKRAKILELYENDRFYKILSLEQYKQKMLEDYEQNFKHKGLKEQVYQLCHYHYCDSKKLKDIAMYNIIKEGYTQENTAFLNDVLYTESIKHSCSYQNYVWEEICCANHFLLFPKVYPKESMEKNCTFYFNSFYLTRAMIFYNDFALKNKALDDLTNMLGKKSNSKTLKDECNLYIAMINKDFEAISLGLDLVCKNAKKSKDFGVDIFTTSIDFQALALWNLMYYAWGEQAYRIELPKEENFPLALHLYQKERNYTLGKPCVTFEPPLTLCNLFLEIDLPIMPYEEKKYGKTIYYEPDGKMFSELVVDRVYELAKSKNTKVYNECKGELTLKIQNELEKEAKANNNLENPFYFVFRDYVLRLVQAFENIDTKQFSDIYTFSLSYDYEIGFTYLNLSFNTLTHAHKIAETNKISFQKAKWKHENFLDSKIETILQPWIEKDYRDMLDPYIKEIQAKKLNNKDEWEECRIVEHKQYMNLLIAVIDYIQKSGFMKQKFGRQIPIIIYSKKDLKNKLESLNIQANGKELIREFLEA